MTPSEFKAWFDGFTEGLSGTPNKAQWERIKTRVKEIDDVPVSYPVYVKSYRRHWNYTDNHPIICEDAASYDSHIAMHAIGVADFSVT